MKVHVTRRRLKVSVNQVTEAKNSELKLTVFGNDRPSIILQES